MRNDVYSLSNRDNQQEDGGHMLLSFTLENWMSFRDQVTFSMIAGRERQHREHVFPLKKFRTSVLPFAAIYGGNASGKSNFFKALNFVHTFVSEGTQSDALIPVEPNRLDKKSQTAPSSFSTTLLVNNCIFEYSFSTTSKMILEEKLVEVLSDSEKVLFVRRKGKITFDKKVDNEFMHFAFRGTRDNQLFLTNSVSQKVDTFKPVYLWFKNMTFISPNARFRPFNRFMNENDPLSAAMSSLLKNLDTGISHLGGEKVDVEMLSFSPLLIDDINKTLGEDGSLTLMDAESKERYIFSRKDGRLLARKLVAYHTTTDGTEIRFTLGQESDGTLRMIDLLPAFLNLTSDSEPSVYIIDEIDRSLHTQLTRKLISNYLSTCSPNASHQLLITTHDVMLMDQDLLRRDEMWITERDPLGNSTLISFSEFQDVRYDKDIRKSYLQGRLGGVPKLLADNTCYKLAEESGEHYETKKI